MKLLGAASLSFILFKPFSTPPKTLKTLFLYPQIHGSTNLINSAILEPNLSPSSKNCNFGCIQLHYPIIYDLNPSPNPENSTLGDSHFFKATLPSSDSKNADFGNTHLPTSLKQSEPMVKTNLKPYFLTPCMFCLSYFSKPIGRRTPYHLISPKIIQIRSFSVKSCEPNESSQPIDVGSSLRKPISLWPGKPISLWPGMCHSPATDAFSEAWSTIFKRLSDYQSGAPAQSEPITKTPSQSRTGATFKFTSDYALWEQYRNPWNGIRMGKLLEDFDALAVTISYKHCCNNDGTTRPILLVTASVDKIVLKKPIRVDADLTITGAVTWVGRSSMEIQLEVTQSAEEALDSSNSVALVANFTFVARDSTTGKSALINRLQPETDRERKLWEEAEERNKMRKQKRVQKQEEEIHDGERDRLNKLLAEGRVFCDMPALADRDSILIKDTCLQNSLICQPQQRNIHGRIFGGFLMRRAFELAFATTYTFAGSAPRFLEVDHVNFLRPVDVGDFLRLKSCVLYTELQNPDQPLINVEVVAHVTRPECRSSEVSNKFYFTFTVHSEAVKNGLKIRNVVPATEEEARRVIERIDAETS